MQFIDECDKHGGGNYTYETAANIRSARYWHSRNTNPSFTFDVPRYATAYAESTFPLGYFNDGRRIQEGKYMDCREARTFYEHGRMPDDYYRREGSFGMKEVFDTINHYKTVCPVKSDFPGVLTPPDRSLALRLAATLASAHSSRRSRRSRACSTWTA